MIRRLGINEVQLRSYMSGHSFREEKEMDRRTGPDCGRTYWWIGYSNVFVVSECNEYKLNTQLSSPCQG